MKQLKIPIVRNNSCYEECPENLIDKATLALKLSYSISYVDKLMKRERIPFLKIGRTVRFKYSNVINALEKWSTA